MIRPTMPAKPADSSPEAKAAMAKYWSDSTTYYNYRSNLDRKEYHKAYYAKYNADKTRERQLTKLKELIRLYPNEAQLFINGL